MTNPSAIMARPARLRRAAFVASLSGLVAGTGGLMGDWPLYGSALAGLATAVIALGMLLIRPDEVLTSAVSHKEREALRTSNFIGPDQ